jgi:Cu-processing system permease protein
MLARKVFKHEFRNIVRSRMIPLTAILIFVLGFSCIRIAGDFSKALLALYSILSVVVPLFAMLFTGVYWYYSDRFTQLVLTMPIQRSDLFIARWSALILALGGSIGIGLIGAFATHGGLSLSLFLACALILFLVVVFVSLGLCLAILCNDRMKGIGGMLALWLYFVVVHDGGLLVLLALLKDYPMDIASALLAALNPIGLVRVGLLLHLDAPLLLSQTGAMIRRMVTSWEAYTLGTAIAVSWVLLPTWVAKRRFERCDF